MLNGALSEKDVVIIAHMLIARHGVGAAAFAEEKAQEFNLVNKRDGRALWNRIMVAIERIDGVRRKGA